MIWFEGRIVDDDALKVSVLDRTFEHGLGLFETFRTWNRQWVLLDRHRLRMQSSARELGLPLDESQLPGARDAAALIEANREVLPQNEDVRVRITLTGGIVTPMESRSMLWMTAEPLPPAPSLPEGGAVINRTIAVDRNDPLVRHKTLNYWRKRLAHIEAAREGDDEVLTVTADGMICEGSRSNLFVVEGGKLHTPDTSEPLLPGIMRRVVLERAKRLKLKTDESPLPLDAARSVSEAFLTNSVRGIMPVSRLFGKELPVCGPVTAQLALATLTWLRTGGSFV
jgi:branched-chain amino acid aminotransferase